MDEQDTQLTNARIARTFSAVIVQMIIGGMLALIVLPLIPEGFYLLYFITYGFIYWELTNWYEDRQFRKELKALDQPGWDR